MITSSPFSPSLIPSFYSLIFLTFNPDWLLTKLHQEPFSLLFPTAVSSKPNLHPHKLHLSSCVPLWTSLPFLNSVKSWQFLHLIPSSQMKWREGMSGWERKRERERGREREEEGKQIKKAKINVVLTIISVPHLMSCNLYFSFHSYFSFSHPLPSIFQFIYSLHPPSPSLHPFLLLPLLLSSLILLLLLLSSLILHVFFYSWIVVNNNFHARKTRSTSGVK